MISVAGIGLSGVDLNQFEEDIEESSGIPYCQVLNPLVGATTASIKKNPFSYGLIVSKEQAEQVYFAPDSNWTEKEITIVSGDEEIVIDSYHTHNPQFIVISRSQLEVQERTDQGWRYIGLGYDRGNMTEFGRLAKEDTSNPPQYRQVVRYLLVFIGDDGQPLHKSPLALTGRGGFGGAFGKEVSSYFQEFDQAYCRATKSRGRLSPFAQAFILHSQVLNFHKAEKKMAYCCVSGRLTPVVDQSKAGEKGEIKRDDRSVETTALPVGSLMFPKDSDVGQQIIGWTGEYPDFGKPNRGRDEASDEEVQMFSGVGVIESPEFDTKGNCTVTLLLEDGTQQKVRLADHLQSCLDVQGNYSVKGVMQAGIVVAEEVVLANGPTTPMETADQGSLAGVGY